MKEKNILISGTMRSGTTLMCAILDAHPEISMASDYLTWFWKQFVPKFAGISTEYELEWALYEMEPYMIRHSNPIDLDLLKQETIKKGISFLSFYDTLFEQLSPNDLKPVRGIKVTHLAYHYEYFILNIPNPFIIHMVRNCMDVYCSHKKRAKPQVEKKLDPVRGALRFFHTKKAQLGRYLIGKKILIDDRIFNPYIYNYPIRMIDEWNITNRIALEIKERFPEKVEIVKYEDLVTEPRGTLQHLIKKLGIHWYEGFYDYANLKSRDGSRFMANTSYNDKGVSSNDKGISGFSTDHINIGNQLMSPDEKEYYERVAKETACKLGYEVGFGVR
ncbi:MAG: sulfotransferase family protein [bacterium]